MSAMVVLDDGGGWALEGAVPLRDPFRRPHSGAVRPGVPWSAAVRHQHLPVPFQVRQQQMMAATALEPTVGLLLLRVHAGQRAVNINDRPVQTVMPCGHRALRSCPAPPRLRPSCRGRLTQTAKRVLVGRVSHPRRVRVRAEVPEQVRPLTLDAKIGQAVTAIGWQHRQIAQSDPLVTCRGVLACRDHRQRQRPCSPTRSATPASSVVSTCPARALPSARTSTFTNSPSCCTTCVSP